MAVLHLSCPQGVVTNLKMIVVDNGFFRPTGLTRPVISRIFNQLTSGRLANYFFPAFTAGLWRYSYEQENVPAE
jgi:hypothetical protein